MFLRLLGGIAGQRCRSGLASDFDGVSGATPVGMDSAADLPKITQALLDRCYSADDIRKILGGNLLRVLAEVERVSAQVQSVRADAR
jgi:membrane dipeptidase